MPTNTDDFSQEFTQSYETAEEERTERLEKAKARYLKLRAEMGSDLSQSFNEDFGPHVATAASPSPDASTPESTEGGWGAHLKEILPSAYRGAALAVENTAEALDELWDFGAKNWETLNSIHQRMPDISVNLPKPDTPETGTGTIVQSAAQFLTGFLPATRALKMVGLSGGFLNAMAAGAAADYAVYDPHEARLADAIQGLAPELKIPIVSYLTADPNDSAAEGRFKNVIEGVLTGVLAEGIFKSVKAIKGSIGQRKVPVGDEAAAELAEKAVPSGMPLSEAEALARKARMKAEAEHGAKRLSQVREDAAVVLRPTQEQADEIIKRLKAGEEVDFNPFINMDNMGGPEDIHNAFNLATQYLSDIYKKAGKDVLETRSLKDTQELAERLGMDPQGLKDLFGFTEDLPEKIVAAKGLLVASGKKLDELVQTVLREGSEDPLDYLRLKRQTLIHTGMLAEFKSVQTNTARALNAMKVKMDGIPMDGDALEMALAATGGRKNVKKLAHLISATKDLRAMDAFLQRSTAAKTTDALYYYWINSILSSPTTSIVNILGNISAQMLGLGEHAIAATKNAVTGTGEVSFSSLGYRMMGMISGLMDSTKISAEVLRATGQLVKARDFKEIPSLLKANADEVGTMWRAAARNKGILDPAVKMEYDLPKAISGEALGLKGATGKFADFMGFIIGLPGRALITADEVFKTVSYRGYLYETASREGIRKGLRGSELKQFIADFVADPTVDLHKQALKQAKYETYQNELGRAGRNFSHFVQETPFMRFVLPFIRTPLNIMKFVGHHTPGIARFSKQMQADIAAGGARAELAKAKVTMGGALYTLGAVLAYNGIITGGAHEEYQYQNGKAKLIGKQPYSIKVGNEYYAFHRLDPIGAFFGLTADMVELMPHLDEMEWDELASTMIMALSKNVTSKTFMQGLTDALDALTGEEHKARAWVYNYTKSWIPNFMASSNRAHFDKEMKEIQSIMDAWKSRIWGASHAVYPQRHIITGEPILYEGGDFTGYSPIHRSTESDDPVLQRMYELDMKIGKIPKTLAGGAIKLTPQEYDDLQRTITQETKINGKNLHEQLTWLMGQDFFNELPVGIEGDERNTQQAVIRKWINRYRNMGRGKFQAEHPEIAQKVINEKLRRRNALDAVNQQQNQNVPEFIQ